MSDEIWVVEEEVSGHFEFVNADPSLGNASNLVAMLSKMNSGRVYGARLYAPAAELADMRAALTLAEKALWEARNVHISELMDAALAAIEKHKGDLRGPSQAGVDLQPERSVT